MGDGRYLLTYLEELQLVRWINAQALACDARTRTQITAKVREILKLRRRNNRRGGRRSQRLGKKALRVITGEPLGQSFFTRLFAAHRETIKWVRPDAEDLKRSLAANEDVVQAHFRGKYGVLNALEQAGILVNGRIEDPRRVLNCDESPQFVDFGSDRGGNVEKVAGSREKRRARTSHNADRRCNTVDVCWSLDGFQFGIHLILQRKTTDMNISLIESAKIYDDTICERSLNSYF
eukprot:scaffold2410_cov435-Pinguiococcus_pyrenoidosus.AAC.1